MLPAKSHFPVSCRSWLLTHFEVVLNYKHLLPFFFLFTLFIQLLGFQSFLALPRKPPWGKVFHFMRKVTKRLSSSRLVCRNGLQNNIVVHINPKLCSFYCIFLDVQQSGNNSIKWNDCRKFRPTTTCHLICEHSKRKEMSLTKWDECVRVIVLFCPALIAIML